MQEKQTVIKIKGGRYSIERVRDGAGDSGMMLQPWDWTTNKPHGENGTIVLGYGVKCGSIYARTMQAQDWWLTTPILEVLEKADDDSWVKVRTENSVYLIRAV